MILMWRCFAVPAAVTFLFSTISLADPLSKEQLFQLATVAAAENQTDRSVELFQKVIEIDPKFAPAYNGLGLLYQSSLNDINEALRYFRLAADIDPRYWESWSNLGRAYYAKGYFLDAEKSFLEALKINPGQLDVELALSWVYLLGQSRPEEAIRYFERVISRLGGQEPPMIYYGLGLAYLLKGDRFKVLDAVTQLRRRKKEEEAVRLEKMVRENIRLSSKPGTPLVMGDPQEISLFDEQLKELEASGFKAGSKDGIKVRLKGPLL